MLSGNDDRCVSEDDFAEVILELQDILCLHHWRINCRFEEDKNMVDALMKVSPNRDRNIATITVRKSLIGISIKEIGPLLLHELMHLILDPMVEEHTFQLQYEVSPERLKEYQKRFRRPLEKVVEHLTQQMLPLIVLTKIDLVLQAQEDHEAQLAEIRSNHQTLHSMISSNLQLLNTICSFVKKLSPGSSEEVQSVLNGADHVGDITT